LGGQFRFFKFFIIKELPVPIFEREIRIREPLVPAFLKFRQTGRFHERTAAVKEVFFIISKELRTTVIYQTLSFLIFFHSHRVSGYIYPS
jgi:hypothetical protein